jgi:hypothetical protein
MDLSDFEDHDEIKEIHKSKWSKYHVKDSEKEISFKQWMKENNRPDIIAGTMYEV